MVQHIGSRLKCTQSFHEIGLFAYLKIFSLTGKLLIKCTYEDNGNTLQWRLAGTVFMLSALLQISGIFQKGAMHKSCAAIFVAANQWMPFDCLAQMASGVYVQEFPGTVTNR